MDRYGVESLSNVAALQSCLLVFLSCFLQHCVCVSAVVVGHHSCLSSYTDLAIALTNVRSVSRLYLVQATSCLNAHEGPSVLVARRNLLRREQ
jgi:hypothetical protein